MTKGKILIAAPVHPVLTEGLLADGYQLDAFPDISQATAFPRIADCSGVITSTRLQLDRDLIDAAPGLRFIGRMGSGMEVIDLPYATQKGIACYASPEGNCNAVAEHALGMLLSLNKRILTGHNEIKEGAWLREQNRGIELEGKTIGIIGYGHTGRAFTRKLKAFDMNILVYDRYVTPEPETGIRVCINLDPIFSEADIVSFHVPIAPDTVHYFNQDFLDRMQQPFVLINTSRGEVADPEIIYKGIEEKKLRGVCLDVFEEEPISTMSVRKKELLQLLSAKNNVILTPHIAGYSQEALYKMSLILLERIKRHDSKH